MNWYDTLLFLHLLAAFMAVAAVTLFLAFYVATGVGERPAPSGSAPGMTPLLRLWPLAQVLWTVGGLTVIVFGLWLAIYLNTYHPWDGWIIGAIVLWMIASGAGARVGGSYGRLRKGTGPRASFLLHAVLVVSVALLLVDMIYKPGA
jgi:hypothetical protein